MLSIAHGHQALNLGSGNVGHMRAQIYPGLVYPSYGMPCATARHALYRLQRALGELACGGAWQPRLIVRLPVGYGHEQLTLGWLC